MQLYMLYNDTCIHINTALVSCNQMKTNLKEPQFEGSKTMWAANHLTGERKKQENTIKAKILTQIWSWKAK